VNVKPKSLKKIVTGANLATFPRYSNNDFRLALIAHTLKSFPFQLGCLAFYACPNFLLFYP
jgi:hypothetical protein